MGPQRLPRPRFPRAQVTAPERQPPEVEAVVQLEKIRPKEEDPSSPLAMTGIAPLCCRGPGRQRLLVVARHARRQRVYASRNRSLGQPSPTLCRCAPRGTRKRRTYNDVCAAQPLRLAAALLLGHVGAEGVPSGLPPGSARERQHTLGMPCSARSALRAACGTAR